MQFSVKFFFFLISIVFSYRWISTVATQILGSTQMADPNQSLVYSDHFHLSYQNILFMSFHFKIFNYAEAVSNGRFINFYFYTICLQNGISCLYKMIYKTIVQRLTLLFTKCHTFKTKWYAYDGVYTYTPYFLYDSALLDLAFLPVYSKPALI